MESGTAGTPKHSDVTTDDRSPLWRQIDELTHRGQFLDAYEAVRSSDLQNPWRDWYGAERIEVAFLMSELGAPRQSLRHQLLAHREAPGDWDVRNNHAGLMLGDRGPIETLDWLESLGEPPQPMIDGNAAAARPGDGRLHAMVGHSCFNSWRTQGFFDCRRLGSSD